MNYYNQIKDILVDNEINKKVKDYSKNKNELESYYNVGKLLIEAQGGKERAKYGNQIIKHYSNKLTKELGIGYSERNLKYMRKFYLNYQNKIWQPLAAKLNWTQICIIMSLNDMDKMIYYSNICIQRNISKRKLQNIIKEKALQKLILEDLNNFLNQLGNGYSYIQNEYKIKIGDTYNYIDILLYNYIYKCFVVVELKVTPLKKEHIGQIEIYMNYVDFNLKEVNDNKTIGLIVVKENNKYVIKYSSDKRIKAIEYQLI